MSSERDALTEICPAPATAGVARVLALPGLLTLRGLWQYRGFVGSMVGRQFRARYPESLLGSAWALLQPAATILIYTVVFAQVMRARLPGLDSGFAYSIYLCAGLLPWTYFSEVVSRSLTVFIDHAGLLKKSSFPRATLPIIVLLSSTLHFAIIFSLFLLVLAPAGHFPGWPVLALLPLLALQQAFAVGLGTLLGVLNVFFRDVGQAAGVVLQFWFWLTPIVYVPSILPDWARSLLAWNPMTGLVAAYQQILLNGRTPDWTALRWHFVGALASLILAAVVFKRLSADMIDEL